MTTSEGDCIVCRDPGCVFCKIVAGEIPSSQVYKDLHCVAFLDLSPLQPGHTLLVPRTHYERLTDVPGEAMATLGKVLPDLARAVLQATQAEGLNVHQANGACAGQVISHVHLHLIPRRSGDGLEPRWKAGRYGPGEMEAWRKKIAAAL